MPKKHLATYLILFILIPLIILSFCFFEFLSFLKPFFPFTNYLLGVDKPTTYLVLLGNDTEVRANGGFFGSYAKITIDSPRLEFSIPRVLGFFHERKINISFHDIYVPNGQLDGYVKPPDAIQQAFGHGSWDLANADFDPNFPTTATSIRWFLEKGKEVNPDILSIVNLTTIKKILNLVGSFNVPEYQANLTPDNLYLFLQGKAEVGFFAGSTQKANTLQNVGDALFKKLNTLSLIKKYQIAKIIFTDLKNQNLVLNSSNPSFQKLLQNNHYAGVYEANFYDNYGLVELNLGANKANQYVTRQTTHTITAENNQIKHTIQVNFQNSSPESNPNPPLHYGGNYLAYLRLFIPQNATDIKIEHTEIASDSAVFSPNLPPSSQLPQISSYNSALQTISFWHFTLSGNSSSLNLSYSLPTIDSNSYTLTILKQNGFYTSPQTLSIFGKTISTPLTASFTYPK